VGFTRKKKKNLRIYKNGMLVVGVKLLVFEKPNGILCLAKALSR
jgi:hypothetical protein